MIYVLDTNTITDAMNRQPVVTRAFRQAVADKQTLYLCQPVDYEIRRGLFKKNATRKLSDYLTNIKALMQWEPLKDADWLKAAELWAQMQNIGRQFSDVDVLLAAVTLRLDATLISADNDFMALSVPRDNWRSA